MENETKNYKFPKPGEDDFYDINEYNRTLDSIDEELMNLEQKKLDTTGDSSQTVTAFEEEVLRENLESGETLSLTHGKIKKWFSEMKDIAFSGRASDIETDGANRFVSDGEKKNWNSKVSAEGDISDTKIQSLDSVSSEFPIPEEGETSRQFFGKVRKFIQDFNNFKTGIITVGKLVNNGSTTAGGYALDARYGKTLFDLFNQLNNDLGKNTDIKSGTILDFVNANRENKKDTFAVNTYIPPDAPSDVRSSFAEGYIQILRGTNGYRTQVLYHEYGTNCTRVWHRSIFNGNWLDNWIPYATKSDLENIKFMTYVVNPNGNNYVDVVIAGTLDTANPCVIAMNGDYDAFSEGYVTSVQVLSPSKVRVHLNVVRTEAIRLSISYKSV
ncbi:pyocin knob domain-containing protein [Lacrimispora sp. 38-1]|uniref:pyocin knob domain-containing protein n=1 Tax=Lacrimispora sp. 38-1 TaxID=3125778 RepID=UPI003CEB1532